MTSTDLTVRAPGTDLTVREVPWHHVAAVAMREALGAEMLMSDPRAMPGPDGPAAFSADAGTVAYAAVAFTGDGLAIGHAALRWTGSGVELAGVYVVPAYRESAATTALLAAAEAAASRLEKDGQ